MFKLRTIATKDGRKGDGRDEALRRIITAKGLGRLTSVFKGKFSHPSLPLIFLYFQHCSGGGGRGERDGSNSIREKNEKKKSTAQSVGCSKLFLAVFIHENDDNCRMKKTDSGN